MVCVLLKSFLTFYPDSWVQCLRPGVAISFKLSRNNQDAKEAPPLRSNDLLEGAIRKAVRRAI